MKKVEVEAGDSIQRRAVGSLAGTVTGASSEALVIGTSVAGRLDDAAGTLSIRLHLHDAVAAVQDQLVEPLDRSGLAARRSVVEAQRAPVCDRTTGAVR